MKRLILPLSGLLLVGIVTGGMVYALVGAATGNTVQPVVHEEDLHEAAGNDVDLHGETVALTNTPPVPFPETAAARALLRAFTLLGEGARTDNGWVAPAEFWSVVERNYPVRDLPPGLESFQQHFLGKGRFEIVGNPLASEPLTEPRMEKGRRSEIRFVYLLISQADQWFQVKVRAEFLTYADGRVLLSQLTLGAPEVRVLEPAVVPRYRQAHGA